MTRGVGGATIPLHGIHGRVDAALGRTMIRVRPMTEGDAVAVAELTEQLGYPVAPSELLSRFRHLRGHREQEVLVAVGDEDRPVGWIQIGRVPTLEASDVALIGGLVVDERHRSAGIGAQLVAAAETWAWERGCVAMMVRSRVTRERAHRFYQHLGYRERKRSVVFEKPLP